MIYDLYITVLLGLYGDYEYTVK